MKPVIFSLAGEAVSAEERALFKACDPAGYILFGRNIRDPEQVRAMTDELRDIAGRDDVFITIDQEGGRVARMKPPHWPAFPASEVFDDLYDRAPSTAIEAARCNGRALAAILDDAGLTAWMCGRRARATLSVIAPSASSRCGSRHWGAPRWTACGRAAWSA